MEESCFAVCHPITVSVHLDVASIDVIVLTGWDISDWFQPEAVLII